MKAKVPRWLIPLLLISAFSILGLGMNLLIGSLIPFWLLLGFSTIYSTERWFSHITRKSKAIGKLYRLILNLGILSILGLLIWSGIKLFSGGFHYNPVMGSLIFLAELVFFIWIWKMVARNSWRWPSMKLTVFSLLCLSAVFTFAGVPPLSIYKDTLVLNWKEHQVEQAAERAAEVQRAAEEEQIEQPKPPEINPIPRPPPVPEPLTRPPPPLEPPPESKFDKVTSTLTSPELIAPYMEKNLSYDFEKYQRFLAGEEWGWDTAEEVFNGKKTHCGGYAIFALHCLLKSGYEYNNFEEHKDKAAVILGCWNTNIPNARDVHTVLLYIEEGIFYTIDGPRIRGPFDTIEEAATTSLPTWTVCYFYDMGPWVTETVERVVITEESNLQDPSWEELKAFLKEDKTDQLEYIFPTFVCADFARALQENAKEAGWRCALAEVQLEGYPDWFQYGIPSNTGHGLNAFETTNRGLIYIDVARSAGPGPRDQDCIVDVQVGRQYRPKFIFPSKRWRDPLSMGTITSISNLKW